MDTTAADGPAPPRALRLTMWAVALALGAAQAVAYRHALNPDGLSYLDAARAFASGDWTTALNPHWGPLYPAAVALAMRLTSPGIGGLIPLVHAVSFAVFVVAVGMFDYFLHGLLRERGATPAAALFGYAVFLHTALGLTGLALVTPDLAVMASVFGAAGLIVRMRQQGPTLARAALLGLVLALGYFAKSVMFVLGIAFIGGLLFLPNGGGRRWRAIIAATVVFLSLASLLVVPYTKKTGTPTFGTAGKLAYNWEVNGVPYTNWQGDARSRLEHPPRQVRSQPDLFEYSGHLSGTYPPWFDPAYWNAGAAVPIRPSKQIVQILRSTDFFMELFVDSIGAVATLVVLLTWSGQVRSFLALLVPALAALAIYWPVHLEPRYVGPFAALLWLVPVATARPAPGQGRFVARATTIAAFLLIASVAFQSMTDIWKHHDSHSPHALVALELRRLGLRPGDRVANVGVVRGENLGSSFEGYWAYLAGVRIVAEIPEQKDFICRDPAFTDQVLGEFAAVGARAVITRAIPAAACTVGWQAIKGTDFYVRLLPNNTAGSPDAK